MRKNILIFFITFTVIVIKAQMPTEQVSNLSITDTFAWKINLSFKVPTSSDSAILIISKLPISSLSISNRFYGIGYNIQSGVKVHRKFFKGTNTILHTVYGLEANTTYYGVFYTFNNNSNGIFYNQTNPTRFTVKTKGKSIGNYYQSLDTNRASFLSSLSKLLQNHDMTTANYSDFRNLVSEVYERDTFVNDSSKKYVTCAYSDVTAIYTGAFSFSATKTNREHTLPKNWMNFRGIPNPDLVDFPEGADWHNLTLANETVNSQRSDFVFKIPKNPSFIGKAKYYENKSKYTDTANCFEPQNSYKGNAARCVFYMQTCYNKILDSNWGFKNGLRSFAKNQSQDLLKDWARLDTVDNLEIARHECIYFYQKNRNPFIDFPNWIDCIDFNDIHLLKTCEGLVITKPTHGQISNNLKDWDVWYYSIDQKKYVLKCYLEKIQPVRLDIYDLSGKVVLSEQLLGNMDENSFLIDCHHIPSGMYVLNLSSENLNKSLKLLVE